MLIIFSGSSLLLADTEKLTDEEIATIRTMQSNLFDYERIVSIQSNEIVQQGRNIKWHFVKEIGLIVLVIIALIL